MHDVDLTIRTNDRGLHEIIIETAPDDRASGIRLLERLLPALTELERTPMSGEGTAQKKAEPHAP